MGALFFAPFEEPSTRDVRSTQNAVAGKIRHRSKKTTAATRRPKKTPAGTRRRRTEPARAGARHPAHPAKTAPAKTASAKTAPAKTAAAKTPPAQAAVVAKAPVRARKPDEGAIPAMSIKKPTHQRQGFKTSEFIVYPSHGVGQIVAIEEQEVAGAKLELFVIHFVKDKMTLRVPTAKVASVGMRKLAEGPLVRRALETLKGRARVKRTMWSRRAQEYEAKINSGDIVAIAEVVRDLFRSDTQPEQSYSERQLYEAALDRLAREISAVQRITETEAIKEIEAALAKGPRRGPKPGDGADEGEGEEQQAVVEDEAA
jgi:CarD family transcriptional regulator